MKHWPGFIRAGRAAVRRVVRPGYEALTSRVAAAHRARLEGTTFIGVTGSMGKTMTKFLIGSVLSTAFRGDFAPGTRNNMHGVARSLLRRARKGDQYHIVELSGHAPGALEPQLELVRPRIGVVTTVGTDHYSAFGSVDAIAAEKGRLVRWLPADGVAILNADDPRVLAMADGCRARVITVGLGGDAIVRAEDVSAAWPDPLSFSVVYQGAAVRVRTQLFGAQWVTAALEAIATGIAFGIPLEAAADALGRVESNPGRMSPLTLPDGTTFVRDDWKASARTIRPALEFLKAARAKRKIAVIGTISDTVGTAGKAYVDTARQALEGADTVCFVGPRAFAAMRAQPQDRPERLRAFATVKAANQFLSGFLQPGDLILIKGSNNADHLYRLALSRTMPVACWRMDCGRSTYCNLCELVTRPSDRGAAQEAPAPATEDSGDDGSPAAPNPDADVHPQVLVGLGNPGDAFSGTPHNVGHEVLDGLAAMLHAHWRSEPEAAIAVADWQGIPIWLVKPDAMMNQSGPALRRLSERTRFRPQHCILVYDDLDLPLGAVRTRLRGSDGGHRGVRSVLEAFQSDQFRRVKIGVRRQGDTTAAREAVLRAFTAEERTLIDPALVQARKKLQQLVQVEDRPRSRERAPRRSV